MNGRLLTAYEEGERTLARFESIRQRMRELVLELRSVQALAWSAKAALIEEWDALLADKPSTPDVPCFGTLLDEERIEMGPDSYDVPEVGRRE